MKRRMSLESIKKKYNFEFIILLTIMMLSCLVGCNQTVTQTENSDLSINQAELPTQECNKLSELLKGDRIGKSNDILDEIKQKRMMLESLQNEGYTAVDCDNQIDMVNPEAIVTFNTQVEQRQNGKLSIVVLLPNTTFAYYEFVTSDGDVEVCRHCLEWEGEDDILTETFTSSYAAYSWKLTDNYLFFEEYHMQGYDGFSGHSAFRVKPLDETCRQLNQDYIKNFGYALNNLFSTDWSESDYGDLDFYDVYQCIYNLSMTGKYALMDEGKLYDIPANDFEEQIGKYIDIEPAQLKNRIRYNADKSCYEFRTRTTYDHESSSDNPYPEVVAYQQNEDGTITLTVNAVWPEKNTEHAITSEVTIRLMPDGSYQFVSNKVIQNEIPQERSWYTPRLTEEEWNNYFPQ